MFRCPEKVLFGLESFCFLIIGAYTCVILGAYTCVVLGAYTCVISGACTHEIDFMKTFRNLFQSRNLKWKLWFCLQIS